MHQEKNGEQLSKKIEKAAKKVEKIAYEISDFIDEIDEIKTHARSLTEPTERSTYPGLNFVTLRNALCTRHSIDDQIWVPSYLATTGEGPWESQEFDDFLQEYGFELYAMPNEGIDCLIVGAVGWDDGELSEQIYNRTSTDLKIYTQELFVFGLIIGKDPYEFLEQEAIDEIGEVHSAIKYILEREFAWPSWPFPDETNQSEYRIGDKFIGIDWAKESVLKSMGYSASVNGPSTYDRHDILRRAFEMDFPAGMITYEQRQRWGAKKSAERLYAISHFLSWLIGFQGTDKPAAKAKWESDLQWLRQNFYSKTMKFAWPVLDRALPQTISSKPARPLADDGKANPSYLKPSQIVRQPSSTTFLKRPSNALARLIGVRATTYGDALTELENYISDRNLDFDGRSIRCDQPLFALSGKASIRKEELNQLIINNLF